MVDALMAMTMKEIRESGRGGKGIEGIGDLR
jgi:hypothetical protein